MADTWMQMTASTWHDMQMQFQIYQYTSILLVFVIIGIFVLFRGAWPFVWARFVTHDIVVGVMDKITRYITPNKNFRKYNGMYYYKGEPLPFVKCQKGNYLFAGLPFDVADVDLKALDNPRYKKACNDMKAKGYPDIETLERAVLFSQMRENDPRVIEWVSREGFKSYTDAKAKINPAGISIEDPDVAQFFTKIPLADLLGYASEVPSDDILCEADDIYEARKPSMLATREIQKILPICVLIFVSAAAVVIIYFVFFKSKGV